MRGTEPRKSIPTHYYSSWPRLCINAGMSQQAFHERNSPQLSSSELNDETIYLRHVERSLKVDVKDPAQNNTRCSGMLIMVKSCCYNRVADWMEERLTFTGDPRSLSLNDIPKDWSLHHTVLCTRRGAWWVRSVWPCLQVFRLWATSTLDTYTIMQMQKNDLHGASVHYMRAYSYLRINR